VLAAGTFDASGVNGAVAEVAQAAATVPEVAAQSLNQLHAVLTPEQRSALADKIDSNWAVWRAENVGEPGASAPGEHGHLAALTSELALTPDQQDTIRRALVERERGAPPVDERQIGTRLHALDDAFRADAFDASSIPGGVAAGAQLAGWGAAHLARVIQDDEPPSLTDAQRAMLAQKLRDHAAHGADAEGQS